MLERIIHGRVAAAREVRLINATPDGAAISAPNNRRATCPCAQVGDERASVMGQHVELLYNSKGPTAKAAATVGYTDPEAWSLEKA